MCRDTDDWKYWLKWKETLCKFEQILIFQMGILNKLVMYAQPMFGICWSRKNKQFLLGWLQIQRTVLVWTSSMFQLWESLAKTMNAVLCLVYLRSDVLSCLSLSARLSVSPGLAVLSALLQNYGLHKNINSESESCLTRKPLFCFVRSRRILLVSIWKLRYLLYWWRCFIPLNKNKYRFVRTWPP